MEVNTGMRNINNYERAIKRFLGRQSKQAPKLSKFEYSRTTTTRVYYKGSIILFPGGRNYDVTFQVKKKDLKVELCDKGQKQIVTDLYLPLFARDMAKI